METMDGIDQRFGGGSLRPTVSGVERKWTARTDFLSPRYTTRLEEILKVIG